MQRIRITLIAALSLAGVLMGFSPIGGTVAAAAQPWTAVGPEGGTVVALAADPVHELTVYAAIESAGVFKSTNGGASWTQISQGLGQLFPETLAIGPDGALYLGVAADMWRSLDGGATWRNLNLQGLSLSGMQFAFDAGLRGTIYITDGFDPWKSSDDGVTWTKIPINSVPGRSLWSIAAHPRRSGVLLAGTSSGLYRSVDGGSHWRQVQASCSGDVVLFDPLRPQRVYAGCVAEVGDPFGGTAGNGVVESLDGGATWRLAASGLGTLGVVSLAAPPGVPATVYAGTTGGGVFRTTDAGAHWLAASSGIETQAVGALAINPGTPAVLFAGSGRGGTHLYTALGLGIFRSADAGASWAPANRGIDGIETAALIADSSIPGLLLAASPGLGIFRTRDGGARWQLTTNTLTREGVADLSIDRLAAAPGRYYALGGSNALYASSDRGRSWVPMPALPADTSMGGLAVDPGDSSHLLVGAQGVIFDSHDGGASWQPAATSQDLWVSAFAFSRSAPQVVYGSGWHPPLPIEPPFGSLFKSTDGGASWASVGPPDAVYAVAVDAADPRTVYADTDNPINGVTIKVSRDGGATWKDTGLTGIAAALAASPTVPGLVFAAGPLYFPPSNGSEVWKSVDWGATWVAIDGGIPLLLGVNCLAFDPAQPEVLYACTTGGVFKLDLAGSGQGRAWR